MRTEAVMENVSRTRCLAPEIPNEAFTLGKVDDRPAYAPCVSCNIPVGSEQLFGEHCLRCGRLE